MLPPGTTTSSAPTPLCPTRRPRPPTARTVALAAILLLAPAAVSCSSDGPDGPSATVATTPTTPTTEPGTTTEPEATTTTAAHTVEEQVEAAYLDAMDALFEAGAAADPDLPALLESHDGASLDRVQTLVVGLKEEGLYLWFPDEQPPATEVSSVTVTDATTATVIACTVDNTQQRRLGDDSVVDSEVVSRRSSAEMRLSDDAWKLISQDDLGTWTDGKGCDR